MGGYMHGWMDYRVWRQKRDVGYAGLNWESL